MYLEAVEHLMSYSPAVLNLLGALTAPPAAALLVSRFLFCKMMWKRRGEGITGKGGDVI